ncbi:SDR family NAD(P)-dependent oxidoreductase [Allostreptomyces psammosilenae]|uniref:Short-subunit dehydrogenase n=1 Tax=Allostreptomyces psammosilenae TaxID=1892865 RepID=A0A852ZYE1_9ACTN|nr:SDR family oxidoreductase [Allostreptomyces psammosilenae]NYI07356.1 short-subunit dehydrogenase [Allostreptomyces psammosilenae]
MIRPAALTSLIPLLGVRDHTRSLGSSPHVPRGPAPVAVVSGGSRGLGLCMARELGGRGFRVVLGARQQGELDEAVDALRAVGVETATVACDLRRPGEAARLVEAAVDRYGRLDMVVANAGVIEVGPFEAMADEEFHDAMDTIFWGAYGLVRSALPHLRRSPAGRVLVISSIGGRISVPHLLPYSCAKFAVQALGEGLRAELAGSGVTVTTAVPGLMRTGSHVQVRLAGQARKEYGWFAALSGMPLLSMDAGRAAARIVRAAMRGRPEIVLTPAAKLGVRAHGIAPATTTLALGLVNRVLPAPEGGPRATVPAGPVDRAQHSRLLGVLKSLNDRAARSANQFSPQGRPWGNNRPRRTA